MIKSVIVAVGQTFDGPLVFLGCEQKMVRADRKDPNSPMVPDPGKWTVSFMGKLKSEDGKVTRENFNATLEAPSNPCVGLEEFDKVEVAGLEYNVMASERGTVQVFYRVKALRPVGSANGARPAPPQVPQPPQVSGMPR